MVTTGPEKLRCPTDGIPTEIRITYYLQLSATRSTELCSYSSPSYPYLYLIIRPYPPRPLLLTFFSEFHIVSHHHYFHFISNNAGNVRIHSFHSFSSPSYDRSKASSKASSPHSAIQSFLFQIRVSSPFLKVIQ